jgi:DNA-directed RNA polymerase specialized sigma24 family protein
MSSTGSVTQWIGQLKAGDRRAVQRLWEAYYKRLVALARERLWGAKRRVADEEDVALSAFDSFCRRVERGGFPHLKDRHDLWRLLVVITIRKAINLAKHERTQRQGGGNVRGESAFVGPDGEEGIDQVLGREPTPQFVALVDQQFQRRLDSLPSAELRSVALWKLEGYTNDEIAEKLSCVRRSVERKLELIRGLWGKDDVP